MDKLSLDALAREQVKRAHSGTSGRSAETIYGGHEKSLRQTVIALTAGAILAEHENPGEATIVVLDGRVRLATDEASWDGRSGDFLIIPPARHTVEALTDAAILLTVATRRS